MTVETRDHPLPIPELRRAAAASPSAAAHLRLGTALIKAGVVREAERELRAALELDPRCAGAWVNLGGILLARWDFAASIEANQRAAALEPSLAIAHHDQAIGHLQLGDAEAAIGCLTRVVELEPGNAAAFFHLGVSLQALGRTAESRLCAAYAAELGYRASPASLEALERAAAAAGRQARSSNCTAPTRKEDSNGAAQGR